MNLCLRLSLQTNERSSKVVAKLVAAIKSQLRSKYRLGNTPMRDAERHYMAAQVLSPHFSRKGWGDAELSVYTHLHVQYTP